MTHVTPKIQKVKKHFSNAKQIKALESGFVLDLPKKPNFKTIQGMIFLDEHLVWSEGEFAKIIAKCKCENCLC